MNGTLGNTGVLVSFVAAVIGVVVIAVGLARKNPATVRNGQMYAPLVLFGALVSTVAMEHALLTHDFSLTFVADNNSIYTPLLYTITGLWSALAGSILLWALILAGYGTAMVWRFRRRAGDSLVGWATLVVYVVTAFFFGLMLGPADPFSHVAGSVPTNGLGPNVLLQDNPLNALHPPLLYLGMVGFTLPFAFAVASLITGRVDEAWQRETRRWTLFSWAFLTTGILAGAWWSYEVLGWGGFWAWDPVENAALLPWLVGTAYLHSVMVQERRGLLRIWNLSLIISTFSLTILGTFFTRSGILQSVHAFSASSIGPILLIFFGVIVVTGVGLIAWRGDQLRAPGGIDSPVSREGAFLANNLLFVGFAFVVLLGTVFPLFYEAVRGNAQVAVGAPYFNRMFIPVGLGLLFLMAVAPALPWRKTTIDVLRGRLVVPAILAVTTVVICVIAGIHGVEPLLAFGLGSFAAASAGRALVLSVRGAWRGARSTGAGPLRAGVSAWRGLVGRANGGMIVHIGVVVVAIALTAASGFRQEGSVVLARGQSAVFAGHTIEFLRSESVISTSHSELQAVLRVDGRGRLTPAISEFGGTADPVGTPAIDSTLTRDVYLTIANIPQNGKRWTFQVVVQPLVIWLWIGGVIIVVGSVLSAIPGRRRRRPTEPVSAPLPATAGPIGSVGDNGEGTVDAPTAPGPGYGLDEGMPSGLPAEECDDAPVGAGDRP
ncbi:MAG: heme lyase CcmF/NrfE family subunit [Acidimicrobiales bacterium]